MEDKSKPKACRRFQLYNQLHKPSLQSIFANSRRFEFTHSTTPDLHFDESELLLQDRVPCEQIPAGLTCTTCNITFTSLTDQRQHFKLDWHRHNVKRSIQAQNPITEPEFADIMDGLSSISGSEDESEPIEMPKIMEKVTSDCDASLDQSRGSTSRSLAPGSARCYVYFENTANQIIAMHNVILPQAQSQENSFDLSNFLNSPPKWAVVMISGGHFAAGVFQGSKEILHKTIHRYTVRAKQGGAQSRADNKSGGHSGPKSAGSSLRRYNEQALTQEIQALLKSWDTELRSCEWIFHRTGGHSSGILFGGKSPLFSRSSPQLVSIPFQTKRPTFNELKKVVAQLTTIQVYDRDDFQCLFLSEEKKSLGKNKKKRINRAKSRSQKLKTQEPSDSATTAGEANTEENDETETGESGNEGEYILVEELTEINLQNELQEYDDTLTAEERQNRHKRKPRPKNRNEAKINNVEIFGIVAEIVDGISNFQSQNQPPLPELLNLFIDKLRQEQSSKSEEELCAELNQVIDVQNSTVLHLSVKSNFKELVWVLLECGSDPCKKDKNGKYPYNWAKDKEVRNLFRKFRAEFPDKYDYDKAQVPSALTSEMEQEIGEKKKLLNKLKREKEKQKKADRKEKDVELDEQKRFLVLSDREKRALAADRRLLGLCKRNGENKPILLRCFDCGIDITGRVPFEYNNNKFCSPKCLAIHRKKFPVPLSL